jgi:hypothetical protein
LLPSTSLADDIVKYLLKFALNLLLKYSIPKIACLCLLLVSFELLQEAFKTMPEDEFLRQADKAVNNLKDLIKTQ